MQKEGIRFRKDTLVWVPVLICCLFPLRFGSAQEANGRFHDEKECIGKAWSEYTQAPWFYNEKGEPVVADMDDEWVIVGFGDPKSHGDDVRIAEEALPDPVKRFNSRFKASFTHSIHDSSMGENVCAYRLKDGFVSNASESLREEMRSFDGLAYILPALKTGDVSYAAPNRIEVQWKAAVKDEERQRLLRGVGAVNVDAVPAGNPEQITIDPCRISVWRASALLHEDVHVVYAKPVLFELRPPIECRLSLGIHGAAIGTPIPFRLEIRFTNPVKLHPGSVADPDLKPKDLFRNLFHVEYDRPLSVADLVRSPVNITGRLFVYASGEYEIPGIILHYQHDDGEKAVPGRLETEPVLFRVASLIPSEGKGYGLQVANEEIVFSPDMRPIERRKTISVAAMIAGAVLFVLCMTMLVLSFTTGKGKQRPRAEDDEGETMRRRLNHFAATKPEDVHIDDLAALGHALRAYVAEIDHLPSDALGGSHATFIEKTRLSANVRHLLSDMLEFIEDALSREEVESEGVKHCLRKLAEFMEAAESIRPTSPCLE